MGGTQINVEGQLAKQYVLVAALQLHGERLRYGRAPFVGVEGA